MLNMNLVKSKYILTSKKKLFLAAYLLTTPYLKQIYL